MNRLRLVLVLTLLGAVVLPLHASNPGPTPPPSSSARSRQVRGTVSGLNASSRSFQLTIAGKAMPMLWDDNTRKSGEPKDGDTVEVVYAALNGKNVAVSIKVLP